MVIVAVSRGDFCRTGRHIFGWSFSFAPSHRNTALQSLYATYSAVRYQILLIVYPKIIEK